MQRATLGKSGSEAASQPGGRGGGRRDSRGKVIVGSECLGSRHLPSGIL